MVRFEGTFFKVWCLIFYLAQNCFTAVPTPQQKRCADEIKEVFKVAKNKEHKRKTYALQAYLHLRIPKQSNFFAEDTFINKNDNSEYKIAKKYYEHIISSGGLIIGARMKRPRIFCDEKNKSYQKELRKRKKRKKDTSEVETSDQYLFESCMAELLYNGISLEDNELKVLSSIIENVVVDKVSPDNKFTLEFIEKSKGFHAEDPMKLPDKFCSEEYPTSKEFD